MGEVYLARHPQIGRQVAIKVLASHLLTTAQVASRFLAEARAVERIKHPNVIEIYDFGSLDDGRPYYMMELLEGHELRKELDDRGKLSAAEALPFIEQICAGLQAAHECGVIHRDLKPENVFLLDRQPLTIKLLDFGIAKLLEVEQGSGLTSAGMVMGTPLFIAPEQALGQPELISPRTDIYSLGVMFYWMLAGRPPFEHEATAILLAMHIRDAPPPLCDVEPSVPAEVAALVARCLEKEPQRRPASAAQLAQDLAAAVAGSTVAPAVQSTKQPSAPGTPLTVVPARSGTTFSASVGEAVGHPFDADDVIPRRPGIRWVGLGLAALAVAGGIAYALLRDGPAPPGERDDPVRAALPAARPVVVPAVRAPAAPPATPAGKRHQIVVEARARVSCRVQLDERQLPPMANPCGFEAGAGQRVHLEVTRPGFKPLREEWTAEADRKIVVEVHRAEHRLSAGSPGSRPGRVAARLPRGAVPARPPRATPPAVIPPRATPPAVIPPKVTPPAVIPPKATPPAATPPEATPKPKSKVGEGTLELPD